MSVAYVYQTFGTVRTFKIYANSVLKYAASSSQVQWGVLSPTYTKTFAIGTYSYLNQVQGLDATVKNVCIKTYDAGSYCDSPTQIPSIAPSIVPTGNAVVNACYLNNGTQTWTTTVTGTKPYVYTCLNAGNNWVFSADYHVSRNILQFSRL